MIHSRALPLKEHPQGQAVLWIYHKLSEKGHKAVIAGGAVRDWLRGEMPHDLDLVTDATPDEVAALFPQTIPVGKAFGVVIVVVDGHSFQLATFRSEYGYDDNRRPSHVSWGTPEQDAQRRDFTVNALFYEPVREEIWDFVDGYRDLKFEVLRAIGEPRARFQEDHLRILRAYRFRAQLGFIWEDELAESLKGISDWLVSVSRERIGEEILKLFESPKRSSVIKSLVDNQVLAILFPGSNWLVDNYLAWPRDGENSGLLELGRWFMLGRDWESSSQLNQPSSRQNSDPLRDSLFEQFLEGLKLSRTQIQLAKTALQFWNPGARVFSMRVGEMVSQLWNDDFRRGFEEFKKYQVASPKPSVESGSQASLDKLDSTDFLKKLNLAWQLYRGWGKDRPAPWLRAANLPNLQGRDLGQALKESYWLQLEGEKTQDEVFEWIKKNFPQRSR